MSIKVEGLFKKFGAQSALEDVSFVVETGTVMGILGPNGAGKSTLLKIITGYLQQSSGNVWINNLNTIDKMPELKKIIGYLPENNPLYTDLYISEYLSLTAGFYPLKNPRKRIDEVIGMTGLEKEMQKKIGNLSKGYRQRVGLAQALLHDPELLILDEPTSGLDPSQLAEIRQLIRSVSVNKTVLFSTHIMQEVEAVCDQVLILNQGRIIAKETPENMKKMASSEMHQVIVEFDENIQPELLSTIPGILKYEMISPGKWRIIGKNPAIRAEIFRFAVSNRLTLLTLYEQESSIEKVFLELVK